MKVAMTIVTALVLGSMAMAADAENNSKMTTDTSKNPITGTKTVTKKYKGKMKDSKGDTSDVAIKETTKTKTDGTVTKDTKIDAEKTEKH